MEEKKVTKISLSTFFLIISLIVIIVMGIFMCKFYIEKIEETKKSSELQTQVNSLNEIVSDLQGKIDSISNTINSNTSDKNENQIKELSDLEKQELFNKAIKEQMVLIDDMILTKDFSQKNFTDKEIILILPDSSEGKIFSSYDDNSGFYSKASIDDVEKSAKKLFDKTINVKSTQNNDSIRIINEEVIVEVRSGVGILNAELLSIDSVSVNEYIITFNFTSGSETTETYKLTVNYDQENVVYKSFEK